MIQDLLDRKVVFVTGKGGTGKSTLAVALALVAAKQGKRVLLIEVDMTRPSIEDIFGRPLSYKPSRLTKNIDGANVRFLDALRAYLIETVSIEILVSQILKNKVVRYFLQSTPFAREISFLNTFYHYYDQSVGGNGYNLVIVDLPSTGHAVPILGVPKNVFQMFNIGPLLKRALKMQDFIADHERVVLALVTLPEEMPVNETIEVYNKIKDNIPIQLGPIFMNRLAVEDFSATERKIIELASINAKDQSLDTPNRVRDLLAAAKESAVISERSEYQFERLKENINTKVYPIRELGGELSEMPAFAMARYLESIL